MINCFLHASRIVFILSKVNHDVISLISFVWHTLWMDFKSVLALESNVWWFFLLFNTISCKYQRFSKFQNFMIVLVLFFFFWKFNGKFSCTKKYIYFKEQFQKLIYLNYLYNCHQNSQKRYGACINACQKWINDEGCWILTLSFSSNQLNPIFVGSLKAL